MQGGGDGDGSRRGVSAASGGSLNEQIVVALARLQDDMQSVLERLHTLEALTASQVRLGAGGRLQAHRQTHMNLFNKKNQLKLFVFFKRKQFKLSERSAFILLAVGDL